MVTLNVKKITERFEKLLNIKFEAAPDVSKNARRFRNGNNELIINSRRAEYGCYDRNGEFRKKVWFEAAKVKTTKEAITAVSAYFLETNDRLDVERIIDEVENKLDFQFEIDYSGTFFIDEKKKYFAISHTIPWESTFMDFSIPNFDPTTLTANEVKSADEAVDRLSEFLINNFNCFKAQHRNKQIDEIFED